MAWRTPVEARHRLSTAILGAVCLAWATGCTTLAGPKGADGDGSAEACAQVPRLTEGGAQRIAYLEREVARLEADLSQAEAAMVNIESGLRLTHTRADAVSQLAEARIAVQRLAQSAAWQREEVAEANVKLAEAERQLQAGHSGSAVFFASRARRIAESLQEEVDRVARSDAARFVSAERVNLRSGPSTDHAVIAVLEQSTPVFAERRNGAWVQVRTLRGPVGWVHGDLLRTR
jgi:hypothetical protein